MTMLLDIAPEIGTAGIAAVVGFFLVFAAAAYIAFRVMKRTVRMALRMAIVAVISAVRYRAPRAFERRDPLTRRYQ